MPRELNIWRDMPIPSNVCNQYTCTYTQSMGMHTAMYHWHQHEHDAMCIYPNSVCETPTYSSVLSTPIQESENYHRFCLSIIMYLAPHWPIFQSYHVAFYHIIAVNIPPIFASLLLIPRKLGWNIVQTGKWYPQSWNQKSIKLTNF